VNSDGPSATWESRRRVVLRDSISIGLAVGLYGASFGALSTISGLTLLQTQALSALMFTGASQFAFIGVLGGGGGVTSAITTSILLGIRNSLYGLRLARDLDVSGSRRVLAAQLTLDETTAVALGHEHVDDQRGFRLGFWATGLAVYVFWNLFTFLGALSVTSVGDPRKLGLDAAIPAGFLALLWPRLRSGSAWALAAVAAATALALTPLLQPGLPVLAVAVVAVIAAGLGVDAPTVEAASLESPARPTPPTESTEAPPPEQDPPS
jgi:predicted branched-subunit amino acid permease